MSVLRRLRRVAGPVSAEQVTEAPRGGPSAERGTEALWCVQWPGGRTYHDDEGEAERVAGEMVKARRVEVAVVYMVNVETEGDAA